MKVVLFCGGLGTRLREYSETVPKPMVNVGYRPIIWHLMKYYAHYGHTEFILCLGYRGDLIKQYFLDYNECLSNDFVLTGGTRQVRLHGRDIEGWKITFADTGRHSNIGQRLKAVQHYLGDDDVFLANYSDALSDLPLAEYLEHFRQQDKIASFICVTPSQSFHTVSLGRDGLVDDIRPIAEAGLWINGGFFVFKREFFDYLKDGEELVGAVPPADRPPAVDRVPSRGLLGVHGHLQGQASVRRYGGPRRHALAGVAAAAGAGPRRKCLGSASSTSCHRSGTSSASALTATISKSAVVARC